MVAEKVEGQIVQKMSFKFRLANHSDEPLNKDCVSKGFHNPLSLISIARKMNLNDIFCTVCHSTLSRKPFYIREVVQYTKRELQEEESGFN